MEKTYSTFILLFLLAGHAYGCQSGLNTAHSTQAVATIQEPENDEGGGFIYLTRGRGDASPLQLVDTAQNETISIHLPQSQSSGTSLSPPGDKIAYYFDGYLYIYRVSNRETIKVAPERFGSFHTDHLAWINDNTQIVTDCSPLDNYPISEVCVFDIASGEVNLLTDLREFTTTFLSGVEVGSWSEQTNRLAFNLLIAPETSGHAQRLIFVIDLTTQEIRLLFDERTQAVYTPRGAPQISKDGTKILFAAKIKNQKSDILLLDIQTGRISQITHSNYMQNTRSPIWLDDNTFIAKQTTTERDGYSTSTSHPIFSLSGEILDTLELDEDYLLLSIFAVE